MGSDLLDGSIGYASEFREIPAMKKIIIMKEKPVDFMCNALDCIEKVII